MLLSVQVRAWKVTWVRKLKDWSIRICDFCVCEKSNNNFRRCICVTLVCSSRIGINSYNIFAEIFDLSPSQWPRCLRHESTASRLLWLWVLIPPVALMLVSCECCVLRQRCVEVRRADPSCRGVLPSVAWVWSWSFEREGHGPKKGRSATQKKEERKKERKKKETICFDWIKRKGTCRHHFVC